MAIIGNLASSKVPVSVVATTGSYTVPAGSFAIVRAMAYGGMSLEINGTTVMNALSDSWSANATSSTWPRYYYSVRNNYGITSTEMGDPKFYTASGQFFTNSTARNRAGVTHTYKLPSGTVISGNAYKLIEIY